jgi:hypothetical protein
VRDRVGQRYGAIRWQVEADLDNAIRLVRSFDNPTDAIRLVATTCARGERWAVVELPSRRLVVAGPSRYDHQQILKHTNGTAL